MRDRPGHLLGKFGPVPSSVRLKLLDELRAKTSKGDTQEVQELQPLFHRGLWIFGPEFETIEFTSNEGMTTVIQRLFGTETSGSLKRPDFAILPDSSAGFYSYPKYGDDGAELCVDRLVLIELKKPGISISEEQKSQCWKYPTRRIWANEATLRLLGLGRGRPVPVGRQRPARGAEWRHALSGKPLSARNLPVQ